MTYMSPLTMKRGFSAEGGRLERGEKVLVVVEAVQAGEEGVQDAVHRARVAVPLLQEVRIGGRERVRRRLVLDGRVALDVRGVELAARLVLRHHVGHEDVVHQPQDAALEEAHRRVLGAPDGLDFIFQLREGDAARARGGVAAHGRAQLLDELQLGGRRAAAHGGAAVQEPQPGRRAQHLLDGPEAHGARRLHVLALHAAEGVV
mmetsp:Transcript_19801/g.58919  ORF Transcript_19801/g.58919 Transcript_19801/m.58919 type:complete len:204 (-) Transcript_19801:228-839(-)